MKYIRTKDGRIVKECNLESGFKQTIITIKNKKDNKELRQIVCDDLDDYLEMVVVGEYCKCHKINPKDIKYETTTLFNEILKQADTIEELVDVYILKDIETGYCGVMSKETMEHSINPGTAYGREFYGAIWVIDEKGIPTLKPVAKINKEGVLELLC